MFENDINQDVCAREITIITLTIGDSVHVKNGVETVYKNGVAVTLTAQNETDIETEMAS